jgi:FkbM family methyltransferase
VSFPPRAVAYVLVSSNHGSMIVNRNDRHLIDGTAGYGVGHQILTRSGYDENEVAVVLALLDRRRAHFGGGVVAIDGGANIGVHAVEWARHMHGWGRVIAFEAQEFVYYALAGNIALNNCLNATARLAALGEQPGEMAIPRPDYFSPASFGSLELQQRAGTEYIGQAISYEDEDCATVPVVSLDSLGTDRLDLVKLDVEGMELEVLRGGREALTHHCPIMVVEAIKSDRPALIAFLAELGYFPLPLGPNLLAIHRTDPTLQQVRVKNNQLMMT